MDDINSTNATTPLVLQPTVQHYNFFRLLRFYLLAFIIPFGILFNTLSCAVFLRSQMHKSATVFYFLALACADNVVLVGELILWLNYSGRITGLKFIHEIDGVCKFVHFLRYFGKLSSSWLIVVICIERFIAVAYPRERTWSSTPTKAKLVIVALTVLCVILSCPAFFAIGSRPMQWGSLCGIESKYNRDYHMWVLFVMIFGELVIPSVIVIILTTLIIVKLMRARQQRFLTRDNPEQVRICADNDKQTTIALLAVAIAFVALRTPYVFMYPIFVNQRKVFSHITGWQRLRLHAALDISFTLAVLNYAINFFLYVVTGKRFRGEFKRFLLCKKSTFLQNESQSDSMSSSASSLQIMSNAQELDARNQAKEGNGSPGSNATPPAQCTALHQDSQV